jgi:cell division transport system permease protein
MNAWLRQHRDALLLAVRRLAATPLNTFLSLVAIGIAAALPAGGQMLLAKAMQVAKNVAPVPQISLFLAVEADRAAADEIAARLNRHAGVGKVRFVPREETLARMKTAEGLGDIVAVLPRNPFPDAFVVDPKDDGPAAMENLAREFKAFPRVEHVQLDAAWVRRLAALLELGRTGVAMLAVLLGIGLVAITFNTIRLQVLTQRAEIEVSRLLGATDAYVRRPFHYFGILQGVLGGALGAAIVWAAVLWLASPLEDLARLYGLDIALQGFDGKATLALLALTGALGWLGASLSLHQHLRD